MQFAEGPKIASIVKTLPKPLLRNAAAPLASHDDTPKRQDMLRRFVPTPYARDVQVMHRTVRLETNREAVLDLAEQFFRTHQYAPATDPQFLWRIVCESGSHFEPTPVPFSGFSDSGLCYVSIGQRGFIAVDLENREAVAYFSDRFLDADAAFRYRPPLDTLFCLTAAPLGLTTLSAGCVASKDRGILVLGPPNSGKTTACYLAAKHDLDFHADQVVFLDQRNNDQNDNGHGDKALRVWGDTLPAVFRPETVKYLPELLETTHPSTYDDVSFLYFDKSPMQARWARPVMPIGCVFLNRDAQRKELRRLSPEESALQLRRSLLFQEDARFDAQITQALTALTQKPVYELNYPGDPNIAAGVIQELLR